MAPKPKRFIWTVSRLERVELRLEQWEGTPHRHRRREIGTGVDCVNLVLDALITAGAIPGTIELPPYSRNVGYMLKTNSAVEQFERRLFTRRIAANAEEFRPGDIVFFNDRRATNHVGILARGGILWHCLWSCGVSQSSISDIMASEAIQCALRIRAAGIREPGELNKETNI